MAEIVKITCGQPFVVYLPLVILNADGSKEAVDASRLTDVAVKLQAQGVDDVMVTTEAYEQYLVLNIPGTMPVAEYNIIVNATLPNGRPFTLRMSRALGVMAWDWQTNWRDYLVGEHIELCDQPFIAGEFTTDAEYEALKQQLREQIAAAEQAEEEAIAEKEQYAEALEHLDDIAKQGDNQNATNTQILYDVNHLVVPPPTGMALESTLTAGITSLQNAITALYGGDLTATLSALKTAIGNIDIDTDDLAKADALADVQSDIGALQLLVGSTTDVSTDSTIFGKFAAVISAISALSIPTVQQIQNGLAKTSELPTDFAKQKALQELYCPNNHANLIKWGGIWFVSTGVQSGGFIIYNNVDVTGDESYIGAPSNPQVGGTVYQATATAIDFNNPLTGTISEIKQIKLSTILDLIGTPATGQQPSLFAAIAAGGGGGTVYPTVQMTETTAALDPNKVYIWGEVASLNISLNAGAAGVANVYFLEFYSGDVVPTITLPASVTDVRGGVRNNQITNIAILNGVAYIA